jgi:hypothetical protein
MESLKKNKLLVILFVIVFVLFIGYHFFGSSIASIGSIVTTEENTSSVGADILVTLNRLKTVHIEDSLFSGAVWMSLKDFSITLPTDVPGRQNIFAPIRK